MYRLRFFILILLVGILPSVSFRAEAGNAEQAYAAGDVETAIRLWEKDVAEGTANAALFYDLGNAYFKANNMGAAVLNYEKALRLQPLFSEARNNLLYIDNLVQLANESFTEGKNLDPAPSDPDVISAIRQSIARSGTNFWAVAAVVLFIMLLCGAALYVFTDNVKLRKVGFFGGAVCLLLSMLSLYCAFISKKVALAEDTCVLMAQEAVLHDKASADAAETGTPLSAGTRFKVMQTAKDSEGNEWICVYLNAEYSGWLPSADIAIIKHPGTEE